MGYSRYDENDWAAYSKTTSTKSRAEIFTSRSMKDEFNPININVRESRDSDLNPVSNAIIIGSDNTGSMGSLAETIIKKGLGVVFDVLIKRAPVSDPHLLIMGVGDVSCDSAPLQSTQFEADTASLAAQLENIYIEGGGGGNSWESYNLPWYMAAQKTVIDCFEKRGKKGYLFTLGDEGVPENLTKAQIKKVFNIDIQEEVISNQDLLALVSRKYHVFHIMVEEGSHYQHSGSQVKREWTDLLGQRAIPLSDHTKLAEVIVSAIQVNEGVDKDSVVASWDGSTSLVVAHSLNSVALQAQSSATGIVKL